MANYKAQLISSPDFFNLPPYDRAAIKPLTIPWVRVGGSDVLRGVDVFEQNGNNGILSMAQNWRHDFL